MECPTCDSEQFTALGKLGKYYWFRCRYCGWEFYKTLPWIVRNFNDDDLSIVDDCARLAP